VYTDYKKHEAMHTAFFKKKVEEKTSKLYGEIFENLSNEGFYQKSESYLRRTGIDENWFEGKICLDAGCGGGIATYALLQMKGAKVFAFDIGRKCLDVARNKCKTESLNPLFLQCHIENIPLKDNVFDFVNCNGVLHHLYDFVRAFSELVRVLKPGGFMFIGVYGKGGIMNEVKIKFFRAVAKIIPYKIMSNLLPNKSRNEWLDNLYVPIRRSFYEEDIVFIFKRHHFEVIKRLSQDFYRRPQSIYEKLKIGRDGMYMHFLVKK